MALCPVVFWTDLEACRDIAEGRCASAESAVQILLLALPGNKFWLPMKPMIESAEDGTTIRCFDSFVAVISREPFQSVLSELSGKKLRTNCVRAELEYEQCAQPHEKPWSTAIQEQPSIQRT